MKSKANLAGHPLHPILIAFPIAFQVGALLADLAALVLWYVADRAGRGSPVQ